MKIKHYCNSFIQTEVNKEVIVCDPWIGKTNESAWFTYPFSESKSYLNKIKPHYIYISHLHCDHFDIETLAKYKNKKTPIIIKNFEQKRLKTRLEGLGFDNIIELKAWKKYKISNEFNVMIIPQITSNTEALRDDVNYDLDTSIVIQSRKTNHLFYNNVDNPLSNSDLIEINNHIKKIFKCRVNVFCYQMGAASGYPQCFLNIDKNAEKKRIIRKGVKKVKDAIKLFKPDIFFPAGGSYTISGKFSILNKYVAQPNQNDFKKYFKDKRYNIVNLEGSEIDIANKELRKATKKIQNYSHKKLPISVRESKYFYDKIKYDKSLNKLDDLFDIAKYKYYNIVNSKKINANWRIEFCTYDNLNLNENGNINLNKSFFKKSYILSKDSLIKKQEPDLICHLDKRLFYCLLKRVSPWNTALTGSIIIFSRKSKKYNVTLENSLNFLAV